MSKYEFYAHLLGLLVGLWFGYVIGKREGRRKVEREALRILNPKWWGTHAE